MSIEPQTAASQIPAAAVVVTHEVNDFSAWKRVFDNHAAARRSAGIVATHVNRDAADPNRLSVYMAASDREKLTAFLGSQGLMSTMHDAGVKGPPHIVDITPVEDRTRKDRPLAGLMIRHEVREFDAWKRGFDGDGAARERAGIVGHAVNRGVRDPNVVVVYLQAESLETLRAFTARPDLKGVMQAAGVVGAPDFSFVQGGDWQN